MIVYIAYVFSSIDGFFIDDFIVDGANSRESAWDEAQHKVFGETLFPSGKMVMLYEMENPF